MPWHIRRGRGCPDGRPVALVNDQGQVVGCHPDEDSAENQRRAIYANYTDAQLSPWLCTCGRMAPKECHAACPGSEGMLQKARSGQLPR